MTLNKSEVQILRLFYRILGRQNPILWLLQQSTQKWLFWADMRVPKMPKGLVLSIAGHNHDARALTEPLKPKWLIFGDHCLRNMRQRPVCSYIWVFSYITYNSQQIRKNTKSRNFSQSNILKLEKIPDLRFFLSLTFWTQKKSKISDFSQSDISYLKTIPNLVFFLSPIFLTQIKSQSSNFSQSDILNVEKIVSIRFFKVRYCELRKIQNFGIFLSPRF